MSIKSLRMSLQVDSKQSGPRHSYLGSHRVTHSVGRSVRNLERGGITMPLKMMLLKGCLLGTMYTPSTPYQISVPICASGPDRSLC